MKCCPSPHFDYVVLVIAGMVLALSCSPKKDYADTVLYNGKVITMDENSQVTEAVAIRDGRFQEVGNNETVLALAGDLTRTIDLQGHAVIPGLIEGHAHPVPASQSEYFEALPDLRTIGDALAWISEKAAAGKVDEWIIHPKFFITRMHEMRAPTLRELDSVAPTNPVFLNGSYGGMVNSRALRLSRMMDLDHPGILRDRRSGKATGFIRGSAFRLLATGNAKKISPPQKLEALKTLFHLYNQVGITSVCSGGGGADELEMFEELKRLGELTVRIFQNMRIPFEPGVSLEEMREALKGYGYKTGDGDEWVRVGALKAVVDGGVLTGTAYMHQGWGASAERIFGISDPEYRGELFLSKRQLSRMITAADEAGWKFTAHVTGGGGVDTLLAAYEEVSRFRAIGAKRFSVIHGNFYTREAIEKMNTLGIYADMQPAWFYKDSDLLNEILGSEGMKTFHPYRTMMDAGIIINGGSDHMVKVDATTSINPYNPFLAMWSVVARKTEDGRVFNPEESISREEALRMYTINNAYASFEENEKGSIATGKLADLVVLSHDILACPEESIREIKSLLTMVGGKIVFETGTLAQ